MPNPILPTKDHIQAFLRFVYQARRKKTGDAYKAALEKFVSIVGEDAPLTKQTYIDFLLETSDKAPATQALYRSAVRRFYRYMADTVGDVDTAFFDAANDDYGLKQPSNFIRLDFDGIRKTVDYVDTMRNNPEDLRDRTFILMLADSGLRVSEACNLRIGDVDLLEGIAAITGKGNKPALVHISNRTMEAMQEYLQVRTTAQAAPVFMRHDKRAGGKILPVTPGYMWHYVKRRINEAGASKKIRIHDFRHYFVTIVYRAKGIKAAQKLARHTRIGTTDRYTHLVEDEGEIYNDIFNK
jgi:integrase/recombinase XerC